MPAGALIAHPCIRQRTTAASRVLCRTKRGHLLGMASGVFFMVVLVTIIVGFFWVSTVRVGACLCGCRDRKPEQGLAAGAGAAGS